MAAEVQDLTRLPGGGMPAVDGTVSSGPNRGDWMEGWVGREQKFTRIYGPVSWKRL